MMGPPTYPESLPPTWEEFCADYDPHFFDASAQEVEASYIIEVSGDPVGQVNYEVRDSPVRHAELDIWLRSESDTGHGYGPDALAALTASYTPRSASKHSHSSISAESQGDPRVREGGLRHRPGVQSSRPSGMAPVTTTIRL
jgi:hypothetical protein